MTKAELAVSLAKANGTLAPADRVRLALLLEDAKNPVQKKAMRPFTCNTASPRFKDFLYRQPPAGWGFPQRFIKQGGRNTEREARDVDALLSLLRHHPGDRRLTLALLLSDRLTQLKTLHCDLDRDGRIRYSCNIAGTETQRHACHKSNTGSGYNLHTTTSSHKHLFLADLGYDLWNVDLSGADGWTIACEAAALGDPTMLDDLRAGLKPAQAVCLLYQHGAAANTWPRERLLEAAREIDKNGWLYMAFKKGIWGYAYGMGEQKQIDVIADESYKETGTPLYVDLSVIRNMRTCVAARYPGVLRRQRRIDMLLERDGALEFANGARREFLGDPRDHGTRKEGYAAHPQVVTTWVTSLAWRAMWYDPENTHADGERVVQPLLLVHDSILFQAPQDRREWTRAKVRQWFNNPITIAGTGVTIPFSGGWGPTWAHAGGVDKEHQPEGKL